jgi:predicted NAD/FAD-binding protein
MKPPPPAPHARGRRAFLKAGAAAALAASLPRPLHGGLPRVGIVGGGLAGVATAWLLDGVFEVVLFESRGQLGGHAHTVSVEVAGQPFVVDVGAQFVAPGPHPTYMRLLEHLGLLDPSSPESDKTTDVDMTITVAETGAARPIFLSPATGRAWTLLAPWNLPALVAFAVFRRAALRLVRRNDWSVPVGDWLEGLPLGVEAREGLIVPLLAAMVGCTHDQARTLSALGAVLFIAKALPERALDPVRYANSDIGLGGNVAALAAACGSLTVSVAAPVAGLAARPGGGYRLHAEGGLVEDVDLLVLATPPHAAAVLLEDLPGHGGTAALLGAFEYFDAEVSIHRDPAYMPPRRRHWSSYNVLVDAGRAEASVWYGALREAADGTAPLLFKSWATARSAQPADEVVRRAFRHPLVTPAFLERQAQLVPGQGAGGVFLAGSYTREVDSQETALVSAIEVVRRIAPGAPNLLALTTP